MIVDATKIEELVECHPMWAIAYQTIDLDETELRENKVFTFDSELQVQSIVASTVLDILDDTCLKDDLGINTSSNYKKLLAIYYLIDYFNILKAELEYCPNGDETYDEFIKRKKAEFKLDCIRKQFACEYDLTDIYEELYKTMGIPVAGASTPGLNYMTINDDGCNIYTIYKTK